MEHNNPEVIAFIKSKIISSETITSGDIETVYRATTNNGVALEGKSIRPIDGFSQEEAMEAAYNDAISKIYDGVAFAMNKL